MTAGVLDGKIVRMASTRCLFSLPSGLPIKGKDSRLTVGYSWWAITFPFIFLCPSGTNGQIMSYPMSGNENSFGCDPDIGFVTHDFESLLWLSVSSWWTSCFAFGLVHQETVSQSMSSPMSGMYLKGDPDIGHWTHGESLPAGNGLWLSVTNGVGLLTVSHISSYWLFILCKNDWPWGKRPTFGDKVNFLGHFH